MRWCPVQAKAEGPRYEVEERETVDSSNARMKSERRMAASANMG